jgi:hypothetical protein
MLENWNVITSMYPGYEGTLLETAHGESDSIQKPCYWHFYLLIADLRGTEGRLDKRSYNPTQNDDQELVYPSVAQRTKQVPNHFYGSMCLVFVPSLVLMVVSLSHIQQRKRRSAL